jgi:hypothetical protein
MLSVIDGNLPNEQHANSGASGHSMSYPFLPAQNYYKTTEKARILENLVMLRRSYSRKKKP